MPYYCQCYICNPGSEISQINPNNVGAAHRETCTTERPIIIFSVIKHLHDYMFDYTRPG